MKTVRHKIVNTESDDDIVTLIQIVAMNDQITAFASSEIFYEFVDRFRKKLKSPTIFDGRNLYEPHVVRKAGFEYYSIGRK